MTQDDLTQDDLDKALQELVEKGLVEEIIGDDGILRYGLTEKGAEVAQAMNEDTIVPVSSTVH